MNRTPILIVLAILVCLLFVLGVWPGAAGAAPPTAVPAESVWVTNGTVNAVAVGPDGTAYIGGSFSRVGPRTGSGAAIDASTGLRDDSFPMVDGGKVAAWISDGSGGWYIGGRFTSVGGVARNRLAHVLSDNSVDPTFDTPFEGVCWVRIDTQAPVTTDDAPGGWVKSDTTINLDANDTYSGVLKTEYRVDGGSWRRGTSVLFAEPSDGSNDGRHTVQYRSVDRAVNIEDVQTVDVCIDTQAPETMDDYDGAPHLVYRLTLTSTDPSPPPWPERETSGVARTDFRIDGGPWKTGTEIILRRPIPHKRFGLPLGLHFFEYGAVDAAGNVEPVHGIWVEVNAPY